MSFQPKIKVSTLFDFVPKQRKPAYSTLFKSTKYVTTTLNPWNITSNKTQSLTNNCNLTTNRIAFDNKSIEWFVIKSSIAFLRHVHNIDFEEGLV